MKTGNLKTGNLKTGYTYILTPIIEFCMGWSKSKSMLYL